MAKALRFRFKEIRSSLTSALSVIEHEEDVTLQSLKSAAVQAQQAAADLFILVGLRYAEEDSKK